MRRIRYMVRDRASIASRLSRIGCSRGMSLSEPKMVRKKARRGRFVLILARFRCLVAIESESAAGCRLGVDIDEAPVDLAPGRAILERHDRGCERRVAQHRAIDQHGAFGLPQRVPLGQHAGEKTGAPRPVAVHAGKHLIQLAHRKGRKRARKARGRARGENKFGRVRQISLTELGAEWDSEPVFHLPHLGRAVEPQHFGIALEVRHRDDEIERVGIGQQGALTMGGRHAVEGVEQQAGEGLAAKGRLKPAGPHKAGELVPHLFPRFRGDGPLHRIASAARGQPDNRLRPEFGEAGGRAGVGIEQLFDIGIIEPHLCQWLQRLAGFDSLREENAVNAPGGSPRDDVDDDPDTQPRRRYQSCEGGRDIRPARHSAYCPSPRGNPGSRVRNSRFPW
jgi:hypothetical protein